jgi:hypothetical protein
MRGDLLRMLQGAAILKVSRNPSRPKSMAAGRVGKAGSFSPPFDHVKHVTAYHWIAETTGVVPGVTTCLGPRTEPAGVDTRPPVTR